MPPPEQSRRPETIDDLLGPGLAARLDGVDLLSRKILQGKLPGERRSKRRGRSVEFDDFRQYVPGDDPRHIDWNILGRLDRLFVKLFREEEDLSLSLIIDASPSMDTGEPNKLVFACRLAAALGYVGLANQNRVSVAAFGVGEGVRRLAPARGRGSVRRLLAFLLDVLKDSQRVGAPATDPQATFTSGLRTLGLAGGGGGRGVVVLLSDCLVPGDYHGAISYLTGGRPESTDAWVLQVLTPAELDPARDPALLGDLRLTDAESARAVEVSVTDATLARYRAALTAHNNRLRDECLRRGVRCVQTPSDSDVAPLVMGALRRGGMLR